MAMDWFGTPLRALPGGYSGETFLVGDADDSMVLRVYLRSPERAVVDASLLRLVRGIVPVPAVVDVRPPTGDSPAVLVTRRLPGVALDGVLRANPSRLDRATLGTSLGRVLAALSGIPFLRPGLFAGAALVPDPAGIPLDLDEWVRHHRTTGRLASWTEPDWQALLRLADQAHQLLAGDAQQPLDGDPAGTVDADASPAPRTVLVHSDFNPKNILVDPQTSEVTGLVDWEFAHAGSVYTDIGNFTRFERDERLVAPMVEAFVARVPGHLADPLRHGRAMDVWALVELAGRVVTNPVGELATQLLLAQARSGDLCAWPWDTARVDPAGGKPVS